MSYQVAKGMLGKATNLSQKGFLQKRIKHPSNASVLNTTKDARQFLWSKWINQVLNNPPTLHSGADQGCSSFARPQTHARWSHGWLAGWIYARGSQITHTGCKIFLP